MKVEAKVAENLFRKATGEGREAVTAAIFWLKTRARWKEVYTLAYAGVPDQPIQLDLSAWPDELLEQGAAMLEAGGVSAEPHGH